MRAASYGIPFMPVRGLKVSDLRKVNDLSLIHISREPRRGERKTAHTCRKRSP